ncbi:hypothetical protein UFOVP1329_44 [uncultured Caudovirales phage]|uniref:Uncharacterized protein n=1 Tax=uncultured Caudovirales phage TaxID=2100421 RepID=A0A6J5QVG9_9CAUD|nr:hypothetical protein UFOVP1150_25 [uncultured Caudovirales phage]CAB4199407.1 hypothetical protein UFOVP1329_44 [uncultured Caudovirales phage]CAB4218755.1 hypothetical protein UFOVP1595_36 [uncultured Caudovirales phage]
MPNQHSPDKEVLSFYIPRTLAFRVRKTANIRNVTITSLIEECLTRATSDTPLTAQDYRSIAAATEAVSRVLKGTRRSNPPTGKP